MHQHTSQMSNADREVKPEEAQEEEEGVSLDSSLVSQLRPHLRLIKYLFETDVDIAENSQVQVRGRSKQRAKAKASTFVTFQN